MRSFVVFAQFIIGNPEKVEETLNDMAAFTARQRNEHCTGYCPESGIA